MSLVIMASTQRFQDRLESKSESEMKGVIVVVVCFFYTIMLFSTAWILNQLKNQLKIAGTGRVRIKTVIGHRNRRIRFKYSPAARSKHQTGPSEAKLYLFYPDKSCLFQ
ncbi:hypothetical protein KUTeg_007842 [Tegillarca granosa]|uniref:Uncharacterized protein n=1 Tax=Tegillarca granosa TaxID=220873 RepID=A0ABQ9FGM6_TEGGR|nr:hypothetical protein KUTeg_007842 [Tegillarca granosa]